MTNNQIASVLNETKVGRVLRLQCTSPGGVKRGYEARIRTRELDASDQAIAIFFDDHRSSFISFGTIRAGDTPNWYLSPASDLVTAVEILS